MKLLTVIYFLFFVISKMNAQPIMTHPDTIDYGCIEQHSEPDREFYIYNVGDSPLQIITINGASAALIPTWPMDPINPGDSASFKLTYNTERLGLFNKSIWITTNEDTIRGIRAIGEVKISTSTADITNLDNILISIFYDNIHIQPLNIFNKNDFEFSIVNINGKIIKTGGINLPSIIEISDLPHGVFVILVREKDTDSFKVIKFYR